mmetsp:Transcript_71046/g.205993  ORF Transcript_71046/g.205993 Transcript_71046/m.205993 type:complete len:222 (+) Transcript_71046:815-1480(+)
MRAAEGLPGLGDGLQEDAASVSASERAHRPNVQEIQRFLDDPRSGLQPPGHAGGQLRHLDADDIEAVHVQEHSRLDQARPRVRHSAHVADNKEAWPVAEAVLGVEVVRGHAPRMAEYSGAHLQLHALLHGLQIMGVHFEERGLLVGAPTHLVAMLLEQRELQVGDGPSRHQVAHLRHLDAAKLQRHGASRSPAKPLGGSAGDLAPAAERGARGAGAGGRSA